MPPVEPTEIVFPDEIEGYNKENLDARFKSAGGMEMSIDISVNDHQRSQVFLEMRDEDASIGTFAAFNREQALAVYHRLQRVMVAIGALPDHVANTPEYVDESEHLPDLDAIDKDLEACGA